MVDAGGVVVVFMVGVLVVVVSVVITGVDVVVFSCTNTPKVGGGG